MNKAHSVVRSKLFYSSLFTFLMLLGCCKPSSAGYSIRFDGPSTVAANTAFSINIYLVETLSTGQAPILGDPDWGLAAGSFQVTLTGTSSITKVLGNSAFDVYAGDATVAPWVITQADSDPSDGAPFGTLNGSGAYELLLGTIQGQSSSANGVTQFIVTGLENPGGGGSSEDMILGDLASTVLDDEIFPSAPWSLTTIGGTVVPEPTSMSIFSIGALILARRVRRDSNSLL